MKCIPYKELIYFAFWNHFQLRTACTRRLQTEASDVIFETGCHENARASCFDLITIPRLEIKRKFSILFPYNKLDNIEVYLLWISYLNGAAAQVTIRAKFAVQRLIVTGSYSTSWLLNAYHSCSLSFFVCEIRQ